MHNDPNLLTMDPVEIDRMTREIEILKTLDSHFIVSLLEADEQCRWYSMPLAEADLSTRGPMLDRCERAEVAMSIARALKDAHDARVIHRDVSPRNVLWFLTGSSACWEVIDGRRRSDGEEVIRSLTRRSPP
jgi:serine/threonine protein kinase